MTQYFIIPSPKCPWFTSELELEKADRNPKWGGYYCSCDKNENKDQLCNKESCPIIQGRVRM